MRSIVSIAVVCGLLVASAAPARAEWGVAGQFSEGLLQESTGVHRGQFGAVVPFGRFAVDGFIHAEGWIGWKEEVGINATGFGGSVGVRYGFTDERFVGPFASLGFIGLGLVGAKKTVDFTPTGIQDIGPGAFAPRLGLGYGFAASAHTTVAVRLEVSKWMITGDEFPADSIDPFPNPWSIHLGLEFMRWFP